MRPVPAVAVLVLAQVPAFAAVPSMDIAEIDRAVQAFTGIALGEPGAAMPVDPRLRLAHCKQPLHLAWFGGATRSVVVQCPQPTWKLHVPVSRSLADPAAGTPVIRRGDGVSIVLAGRGFTLNRPGEALENGARDAWIKVRLAGDKSGHVLRARVVDPGQVTIDLP